MIFLGALVALGGLAFGLVMQIRAREAMPKETFADKIQTMQPAEIWDLWSKFLKVGIGWQPQTGPTQEDAIRKAEELRSWSIVGYCLGGAGAVAAIAGMLSMRTRPVGRARASPTRREPATQNK
jgi:hypothetical protein